MDGWMGIDGSSDSSTSPLSSSAHCPLPTAQRLPLARCPSTCTHPPQASRLTRCTHRPSPTTLPLFRFPAHLLSIQPPSPATTVTKASLPSFPAASSHLTSPLTALTFLLVVTTTLLYHCTVPSFRPQPSFTLSPPQKQKQTQPHTEPQKKKNYTMPFARCTLS
ncbi:hypothetical protein DM02DRAFT_317145 [Periconia macrospinosa]|uniref:Uncharacterized protein n=1 Tax=Periconia macrospinosa TaxID=97972 RepID=A0A2V1DXQ9_9PLEO|nr:hypothetical protein DM02DRAFT_317145 [Periconia macrospinosa]